MACDNKIKDNNDVFVLNKLKNTWSKVSLKQKSIFCKTSEQPHLVLSKSSFDSKKYQYQYIDVHVINHLDDEVPC